MKVLGVVKMLFSNGEAALMLKYQTTQPIDDVPALQAEADELWERFCPDVEKAGYTVAIVSAQEKPRAVIIGGVGRGYNFVYRRATNGEWSRVSG